MGVYILRRLLLMIPTLLGITFLVFMLIALSPGGIGAGLSAGDGQMDQTNRAIKEAYLEDRYGLDAPAPVQYVRWLGRISPIKFGKRDQIDPTGAFVQPPKAVNIPPLWEWYIDELPVVEPVEPYQWASDATPESKSSIYRKQANKYSKARAKLISGKALLDTELGKVIGDLEIKKAFDKKGKIKHEIIDSMRTQIEATDRIEKINKLGNALVLYYEDALVEREQLMAVFDAKPYPEAGFGVIPGISISKPDMGRSFSKSRPVMELISEAIPITILLNLIAIPIIYFIAIPSGMLAAVRSGGIFDRVSGSFYIAMWSFPIPLAGVLMVGYLARQGTWYGQFPASGLHSAASDAFTYLPSTNADGVWEKGYLLDLIWHIVLPVSCLVYGGFAVLSKQTRAAMLDNFNMDYVRTAKAKGVAYKDIVFKHVFRNSLLPLITMFVSIFPAMLAGSVVIERIFTIPGMGNLVIESINLKDRELLLANTMMIAAVNLIALLLADILYSMADPRISYK
ncbi:MAG: ABC transporter permease [Phycisphaerales bacterium]|nr:ABC transporter permease [Phycisphaerales bacterium]